MLPVWFRLRRLRDDAQAGDPAPAWAPGFACARSRRGADRELSDRPGSKLSTLRALTPETATSSLGQVLGLGAIEACEIYAALDWLGAQQGRIEPVPRSLPWPLSRTPPKGDSGSARQNV